MTVHPPATAGGGGLNLSPDHSASARPPSMSLTLHHDLVSNLLALARESAREANEVTAQSFQQVYSQQKALEKMIDETATMSARGVEEVRDNLRKETLGAHREREELEKRSRAELRESLEAVRAETAAGNGLLSEEMGGLRQAQAEAYERHSAYIDRLDKSLADQRGHIHGPD